MTEALPGPEFLSKLHGGAAWLLAAGVEWHDERVRLLPLLSSPTPIEQAGAATYDYDMAVNLRD